MMPKKLPFECRHYDARLAYLPYCQKCYQRAVCKSCGGHGDLADDAGYNVECPDCKGTGVTPD